MAETAALPYEEPSIVTILILASFILLLNTVNSVLDRIIFCGLIGQIFVGVAWGLPGANWLSLNVQHAVTQLGYLGLILIVYEGGLSTSFNSLNANLFLSALVALTGISGPIALSFVLIKLLDITPLQAFGAGAALCSTSLGTTFTILSTSGLAESRLGIILSSAAMLDDVVGLVMVQVITSLGASGGSFQAATVVRPVGVSIAFAVLLPLFCRFIARPLATQWQQWRAGKEKDDAIDGLMRNRDAIFVWHTLVLAAFVAGSSYAGTSNLFAAYLAGAYTSWFDSLQAESRTTNDGSAATSRVIGEHEDTNETVHRQTTPSAGPLPSPSPDHRHGKSGHDTECLDNLKGSRIYERYYAAAVKFVLKPFFFASIGFSIPVTQMFSGAIVWRGIVYAVLMIFGKMVCGLWLVRFDGLVSIGQVLKFKNKLFRKTSDPSGKDRKGQGVFRAKAADIAHSTQLNDMGFTKAADGEANSTPSSTAATPASADSPMDSISRTQAEANDSSHSCTSKHSPSRPRRPIPAAASTLAASTTATPLSNPPETNKSASPPAYDHPKRPLSLYPPLMLGSAMTARGEIGFLISSLAESTGFFSSPTQSTGTSDLFLIVTWAILLCTIIGPLAVGVMVKRVRRLQISERRTGRREGREDPLGVWGVVGSMQYS